MTIVFLQPDGVPITAQAARQGSAAVYGGGSGRPLGGCSGFRVGTASDTLTATSTVWTLKPCSAQIDPGASTSQGMYGWASDANVTGAVTASDATYARKDIVYIQVNDSSAGDGSGATTAPVLYLAGTPTATPAAPTLPARSFLVGTIDVPKTGGGVPSVTLNPARFVAAGGILPASLVERDSLIKYDGLTVQRTDIPGRPIETWDATVSTWGRGVQHIEFTYNTAVGAIPNNAAWGPGILTLDGSSVTTDATLATSPTGDKLTLNKGTYAIDFSGAFGAAVTGNSSWFAIKDAADAIYHKVTPAVEFWGGVSIPNFRVTADNTTLWFRLKQNSGAATNSAGRIRITKLG